MFGLTALELARIQFGFTISFHIIFPAITIGLASYRPVAPEEGHGLSPTLSFLVTHFCGELRDGGRVWAGHGLPVRHQLESLFGVRGRHYRTAPQLRSADRLLSGGRLPGRHAVRMEEGRTRAAFLFDDDGRGWDSHLGDLDSRLQQLDADTARLRSHQRARGAR